ncbi:MAG: hypothetical protein U0132_17235 [Gemmatimonadaceae bacterium]
MKRLIALLAISVLPAALSAQAAKPAAPKIPAAAVGTWEGKSMVGPKDSLITTTKTVVGADGKIEVTMAGRPTMTAKVIAAGGDSLVYEIGPYDSILKKGLKATTRSTTHFSGNSSTGMFEAKYSDGSVVKGKVAGTKAGK